MSHYSYGQRPTMLWPWAVVAAAALVREFERKDRGHTHPCLVYRGMSGISSATALALALHKNHPEFTFGMAYVRKPEERSNGVRVEYERGHGEVVFVDDFVSSGNTMRFCQEQTTPQLHWPDNPIRLMSSWGSTLPGVNT